MTLLQIAVVTLYALLAGGTAFILWRIRFTPFDRRVRGLPVPEVEKDIELLHLSRPGASVGRGLGLLAATPMSTPAARPRILHHREGVAALPGAGIVAATVAALRRHEPDELGVAASSVALLPAAAKKAGEENPPQTASEQIAALEDAYEAGYADAAFALGRLLADRGDLDGAMAALRRADERGHPAAACDRGVLLEQQGDLDGALDAYRHADERGDANGAFNLGVFLAEQGDRTGAAAALYRATQRGSHAAASNLGVLLEEQGDLDGALDAYRHADECGDANGAFNLGLLLASQGDVEGARDALRRAADCGDPDVEERVRAARSELHGHGES